MLDVSVHALITSFTSFLGILTSQIIPRISENKLFCVSGQCIERTPCCGKVALMSKLRYRSLSLPVVSWPKPPPPPGPSLLSPSPQLPPSPESEGRTGMHCSDGMEPSVSNLQLRQSCCRHPARKSFTDIASRGGRLLARRKLHNESSWSK